MSIRPYSQKTYTPCPAGLHHGVCVDLVELGEQPTQDGPKKQIRIVWQVAEIDPATGRRFDVIRTFNDTLHEMSTLRKTIESWYGRGLTATELRAYDSDCLIGMNCYVNVVHKINQTTGNPYAAVAAVMPAPAGTPTIAPLDYTRVQDRGAGDRQAPNARTDGRLLTAIPLPTPAPLIEAPLPAAAPLPEPDDDIAFAFGANTGSK